MLLFLLINSFRNNNNKFCIWSNRIANNNHFTATQELDNHRLYQEAESPLILLKTWILVWLEGWIKVILVLTSITGINHSSNFSSKQGQKVERQVELTLLLKMVPTLLRIEINCRTTPIFITWQVNDFWDLSSREQVYNRVMKRLKIFSANRSKPHPLYSSVTGSNNTKQQIKWFHATCSNERFIKYFYNNANRLFFCTKSYSTCKQTVTCLSSNKHINFCKYL